jgi:hypothetical protein
MAWLCICIIDRAHARAEKKIKASFPELLLRLLLPVSPPTASSTSCGRYGFKAVDALLEPSIGQRGALGTSVDRHWPRFPVGRHLSVN